jgi:hypothetical protein
VYLHSLWFRILWSKSDPVDEWECERAKRIEKIQGNRNEIVREKCYISIYDINIYIIIIKNPPLPAHLL